MNKGGVDEWLKACPESKSAEVLALAKTVPHTCLTCWWLQFKEGMPNRGCRYEEFNKEKLPFQMIPEAATWNCLGWRVDPEVHKRVQGFQGFVM